MFDLLTFSVAVTLHCCNSIDYNSVHPHVRYTNNNFVAGIYYNSVKKPSVYAGKMYNINDVIKTELVLTTGYMYPLVPQVRLIYNNFFVAPTLDRLEGKTVSGVVIGKEFKF